MSESSHSLGKGIWVQLSICCPAAAQREALLGTWNSQQLLPLCNSKCSAASPWLLAAEKRKERKNVAGYSIAWQPYGLCLNLLTHLKNNESLLQNKLFQTDAPAHPEPRTEGVLKHVSAGCWPQGTVYYPGEDKWSAAGSKHHFSLSQCVPSHNKTLPWKMQRKVSAGPPELGQWIIWSWGTIPARGLRWTKAAE